MKHLAVLLVAISLMLQSPATALGQGASGSTNADEQAFAIFDSTMSPFCPGRLLRDCPSSAATELKDNIRSRLEKGQTREEIMEDLVSIYGDQVKAAPETSGFGLLAWITPFVFLGVGLLLIFRWLAIKRRQTSAAPAASVPSLSPEMLERIEREMEREAPR